MENYLKIDRILNVIFGKITISSYISMYKKCNKKCTKIMSSLKALAQSSASKAQY